MNLNLRVVENLNCVLDDLPIPAIIGECVYDEQNNSVDYRYLSANQAMAERMDQDLQAFAGKTAREVFPYLKQDPFDRAGFIARVVKGKGQDETYFYSEYWKSWIHLHVWALGRDRFLAMYMEAADMNYFTSKLNRIIDAFKTILSEETHDLDYTAIAQVLQAVTAAKAVMLNIVEEPGHTVKTVGFVGDEHTEQLFRHCFGDTLKGQVWSAEIPVFMPAEQQLIRTYPMLSDFFAPGDLRELFSHLERQAGFGETVVARVSAGEKTNGYFIFTMPRGIPFHDISIVSMYSRFVGMAIEWKLRGKEIFEKGQQFQALFENMGSGATVFEVHGEGCSAKDYVIREINRTSLYFNNQRRAEAMGKTLYDLNPNIENSGFVSFLQNVWLSGEQNYHLTQILSHDGRQKWYESRAFKLPNGFVSTLYNDVTDRVQAQQDLAASEESLSQLIQNMNQGLAVFTMLYDENGAAADCQYKLVNKSFERLTGLKSAEIIGKTIKQVNPKLDEYWIRLYAQVVAKGEPLEFEDYFPSYGRHYHVVAYRPYEGAFATILTDITEKKRAEEELRYRSNYDHLTGLFNRHYFDEALREMDSPDYYPLTLILADVDDLKMINDIYGHQEGDVAIRKIAQVLKKECPLDGVLSRTGGDEFTVLLPGRDERDAHYLIQDIEKAVAEESGPGGSMSVSIGYASKRTQNETMGEVFKKAEDMMYRNKLMWRSRSSIGTVDMIMQALREKNPREAVHADHVALICQEIGKTMQLSWDSLRELVTAAMMHDIGKIGVPDHILEKPGELTLAEYEGIKKHCESGYKILKPIPELQGVADTVLSHHERWDGSGYPRGISGQNIPLHARIICVADAVSALISARPYRLGCSLDRAASMVKASANSQFDPEIVAAFSASFQAISRRLLDERL
jgi:diguanylate cyclase (GGDEF)-like protein/PAS domain S-box-containing protein